MFPFRGMPDWAQWLGEVLPVTHFLRIVRGVMLKGAGFSDISAELLALVRHPARRVGAGDQPLPGHPGLSCETGLTADRAGQARSPMSAPAIDERRRSPA